MTDNAIITAAQNTAIAVNGLTKATNSAYGTANSPTYDDAAQVVITTGNGRLNNVSVVVSAAVLIKVYDAATTATATATTLLAVVDATNETTAVLNKIYSNGLVLEVGAGAQANVTYSPF